MTVQLNLLESILRWRVHRFLLLLEHKRMSCLSNKNSSSSAVFLLAFALTGLHEDNATSLYQ